MNNLTVLNVTLFGVGAVLIYAAIKDQDPRDVVLVALGQKAKHGTFLNTVKPGIPNAAGQPTTPGNRTRN